MTPAEHAIALCLMLGDDFTEYEARVAFEEAGVVASVSYLQMMGLVNQTGFRVEVRNDNTRGYKAPWKTTVDTYRVSQRGKDLLL